jgi:ArsR family transcriptional regulator
MVQEIVAAGELSCGQVGEKFPLSQPTVSHHLKILTDAGVIVARREGQHAFISVDRRLLQEVGAGVPARLAFLGTARRHRAPGKARRKA